MARPVDEETTVGPALLPAAGGLPPVRGAGGGGSLGRAVGAGYHRAGQRRGGAGARVELAGHGGRVQDELEERGGDRKTCRQVRPAKPALVLIRPFCRQTKRVRSVSSTDRLIEV